MREIRLQTKNLKLETSLGFTLIEMLVVIGVIATISGIFLVNFNRLSGPRNLRIAQNQLTTDIRKIQSFSLSSRNVAATGLPANYYVIKFSNSTPTRYTLGAIDNAGAYSDLQNVTLPKNIQVSAINVKLPSGGSPLPSKCAEAVFSLPFGRVLMDYEQIDSAGTCGIATVLSESGDLSANKNLTLTITLTDTTNPSNLRYVELNGISQLIQGY